MAFAAAILTGTAWEIIEHTEWVLGQFRDTTVNQGYVGDSVLNAVADYVFMMTGFFVGWRLASLWALALILTLEMSAAVFARDSLVLSTVMMIHQFEAIETWQQELDPRQQLVREPSSGG